MPCTDSVSQFTFISHKHGLKLYPFICLGNKLLLHHPSEFLSKASEVKKYPVKVLIFLCIMVYLEAIHLSWLCLQRKKEGVIMQTWLQSAQNREIYFLQFQWVQFKMTFTFQQNCGVSLLAPFVNTFSMIFTSLTPSLQIERSLENLTKNTKQATKKLHFLDRL